MPDPAAFKDMTLLGLVAMCVVALVAALAALARVRRNGHWTPPEDYPETALEMQDMIDGRAFHRRNGDLMHWRVVLEHLAAGENQEALEAFERLCRVDFRPSVRK